MSMISTRDRETHCQVHLALQDFASSAATAAQIFPWLTSSCSFLITCIHLCAICFERSTDRTSHRFVTGKRVSVSFPRSLQVNILLGRFPIFRPRGGKDHPQTTRSKWAPTPLRAFLQSSAPRAMPVSPAVIE